MKDEMIEWHYRMALNVFEIKTVHCGTQLLHQQKSNASGI